MPNSTGNNWMGTPEVAEYLVSCSALHKLRDEGGTPAYKIGRVIRVRTADVDAYLESRPASGPATWDTYIPTTTMGKGKRSTENDESWRS